MSSSARPSKRSIIVASSPFHGMRPSPDSASRCSCVLRCRRTCVEAECSLEMGERGVRVLGLGFRGLGKAGGGAKQGGGAGRHGAAA
eukprot:233611-Chlamydomonas_euryale.AAC.1